MPAASMAAILSSAPPLPPEMMAPAWPMRRPGGAVRPAMKPTIGFLRPLLASSLMNCGRVLLGRAADLADHDDRLGLRVGEEHLEHVDELGALDRIAADADRGGLAEARVGGLEHRLVGSVPERDTMPTVPGLKMLPGMMPILHSPAVIDARAVRPDQARLRAVERALDLDHVEHRDALGDADDERDLGVDRLADGVGGDRRRHVDHGGVGAGLRLAPRRRCRTPAGRDASSRLCRARCRRPSACRRRSPARNGRCRSCR